MSAVIDPNLPDARGHFGPYGGRYVPETLMHPLQELEHEYQRAQQDPEFQREFEYYLREFCGRPTPLHHHSIIPLANRDRQNTNPKRQRGRNRALADASG